MEIHGARDESRFKLMREGVLAMKALWTQEESSFHGEFVNFDPVWSLPKPAQKPHPPILLGGESDYTLRRIVEYCDGWIPRPVGDFTPRGAVDRLRRMAEAKGRDPKSLSISVFRAPAEKAALAEYRAAGIEHFYLGDICNTDGSAWECCPRDFLRRAVQQLDESAGLRLVAAFEQEFLYTGTSERAGDAYALAAFRRQGSFGEIFMAALR